MACVPQGHDRAQLLSGNRYSEPRQVGANSIQSPSYGPVQPLEHPASQAMHKLLLG